MSLLLVQFIRNKLKTCLIPPPLHDVASIVVTIMNHDIENVYQK